MYSLGALQGQESTKMLCCRPLDKLPKVHEIILSFIAKCLARVVIYSPCLYFCMFHSSFKFASRIHHSATTALIKIPMISNGQILWLALSPHPDCHPYII